MKNDNFDDIIREKLSRVTPVYQPGDWERLKERLNNRSLSEQEDVAFFDRMIRNKAPKHNEVGLSKNWNSLMSRLDHIYLRERQVLTSKILELTALLLLLIAIDCDFALTSATVPSIVQNQTLSPTTNKKAHPAYQENKQFDQRAFFPEGKPVSSLVNKKKQSENQQSHENQIVSGYPVDNQLNSLPLASLSEIESQTADENAGSFITPLMKLESLSIQEDKIKANKRTPKPLHGQIMRLRSRPHLSLSMFGSTDFNRIHTPAYALGAISDVDRNPVFVSAFDRYALGYSGGVAIAVGKNRWETESGLIYTAKQYQARPVVYVTGSVQDGYYGEGIKDIEMNIVALPLQWRYDVFKLKGWRLYAGAGASLQVVLESNYAVADQDAFRSRNFNPSPSFLDSPGFLKSTGLSNKNLSGGWLQGGSFADNSFITTNASLGLERRFLGGWSFFAQPTYHHSVFYFSKGLGPDYEQLHTFSLFSGIRVRL